MPQLDGSGPDGKGAGSGRRLGICLFSNMEKDIQKLGKGMGLRRNADLSIRKNKTKISITHKP